MMHILFTHSSINGRLGCFYFWATVTDAAMNMDGRVSVQVSAFDPFGYMPRSGLAGSCGDLV